MKKLLFKQRTAVLAAILFAVPLTLCATEVKKEFHREMVPNAGSAVTVINKFGSVVTETWNQNKVVIDVIVKVENPSQEKAQKILDLINIKFTEEGGNLTAETLFDEDFSSFNWKGTNNQFSIDYNVKMPASINFNLTNKYGNSVVDEVGGQVTMNIKYGDLTVHKLTRGNVKPVNSIVVAYGKASVEEAGWAEINARYCGQFSINKATALLIDSRYSKVTVGEVSSLVADSKYDGYTVTKATNVVIISGYTNLGFETVTRKIEVETKYGNLSVDNVPEGFESVTVKAAYCGVKLGIAPNACYRLTAESSYGSIKYPEENFKPEKRIIGNTSSEVAGIVGNCSSPSGKVTVTTSYGSARLY